MSPSQQIYLTKNKKVGDMIQRINHKKSFDVLFFIKNIEDKFQDFYITSERQRIFLTNLKLIKKVLNKQTIYVLEQKEIEGLLLVFQEKGYRTYIKILAKNEKVESDLLRFLVWNLGDKDLFIKVKKLNPINRIAQRYGFEFMGSRGNEILLMRKKQEIKKFTQEKDNEDVV